MDELASSSPGNAAVESANEAITNNLWRMRGVMKVLIAE